MKQMVIVERIEQDFDIFKKQFSKAFDLLELLHDFGKAMTISIKPNLTYPVFKKV